VPFSGLQAAANALRRHQFKGIVIYLARRNVRSHLIIALAVLVAAPFLSVIPVTAETRLICDARTVHEIGAEDGFFPYTGIFEGELRGFSLDVVAAAFDAAGCKVRFKAMPYARCLRDVERGRLLGCFNTTNSDVNQQKFVFHEEPLFRGKILIYAHPERHQAFTEDDFLTGVFSVVRGYTYTDSFDLNAAIGKIAVESDLQTLALVARKRADFAVVYEKVAQFQIVRNKLRIDPAPVPVHSLTEFDLFISFSRAQFAQSKALARELDRGLKEIRANGTYAAIEISWDEWLEHGAASQESPPHWQPLSVRE
jgi:polar amino acid transport system substrate-binding protein